jgi:DNA-binding transcriptional LysR family regulator
VSGPGTPTIDQLRVFLAVVENGSLAAAGRALGRATSAISYAIENLETVLGIEVFDRETTKRPKVSEAGHAVLAEARALLRGFDKLRARVQGLADGLEAKVSLVVDVMLPMADLAEVLQAFQVAFPTVPIRLYVEALGAVNKCILDGVADLGVCSHLRIGADTLEYLPFRGVTLIPVAAPDHPLALTPETTSARDHVQLVLTDRSTLTAGQDFGVFADRTWRLADLGAKHALLLAGVGWGNMPETMVRADLEAGRLVRLDLPDWKGGTFPLQIVYASASPPGPARRWLIDRLTAAA